MPTARPRARVVSRSISRRVRIQTSIAFRGQRLSLTSGTGWTLGAINAQCGAYSAPSAIQRSSTLTSAGVSRWPALLRRHAERVVLVCYADDQLAGLRVAGDDRRLATLQRLDGRLATVEPQPFGPFRLVLTVASETVPGQDRPDLAIEVDGSGFGRSRFRCRRRQTSRGPRAETRRAIPVGSA